MNFRRLSYSLLGIGILLIAKLGFASSKPANNAVILESDDSLPDTHYHGSHGSHCSHAAHASHYSSLNKEERERNKIFISHEHFINSLVIDEGYRNMDSLNCIVKAYIGDIVLSDSSQTHFKGTAMIISVKDDYGSYARDPRIKVTTHIIPLDKDIKIYFTSNGHLGYWNLGKLQSNLEKDLTSQLKEGWLRKEKKYWMFNFDEKFYNNIIQLHY